MLFEKYRKAYLPKTQWSEFKVDPENCTQCKRCLESCPTGGIMWDEKKNLPYLSGFGGFEKACLNCHNCEAVCPVDAITVEGVYKVLEGRYKTIKDTTLSPPSPFMGITEPFEQIESDLTEVERVIYKRRSNRLYKDKPVSKDLLHRIIEAGRFAPTAGNNMPWKFIVITNKALIDEIEKKSMKVLKLFSRLYLNPNPLKRMVITGLSLLMVKKMDQRPIAAIKKAEDTGGKLFWGAPAVIFILMDKRGISDPNLDSGICGQNIVLAAHALGLGTCYNGFVSTAMEYLPGLRKRLGIQDPWKLVITIGVGHPKGKIDKPIARETVPVEWFE